MVTTQHSTVLLGGLLWHQGPDLGRVGVGGRRTYVQNQKRAGLGAERLFKGPGSGQCPGSGGQAPTWSPGMAGLKKPVLTQSGQAACQGLQGAILWGEVPPGAIWMSDPNPGLSVLFSLFWRLPVCSSLHLSLTLRI